MVYAILEAGVETKMNAPVVKWYQCRDCGDYWPEQDGTVGVTKPQSDNDRKCPKCKSHNVERQTRNNGVERGNERYGKQK